MELPAAAREGGPEITVSGTRFRLDGKPFPYTGISFFNAIYNPAFNRSSGERAEWLEKLARYGINVLRIWAQWDSRRGFVDAGPESTLYAPDGELRAEPVERLKGILADCGRAGMVVELALFAQESWRDGVRLDPTASDRAAAAVARELRPYRNLTLQVWNEFSERVLEFLAQRERYMPREAE